MDQLFQLLVLDREALAAGEVWRLFSCHFAHYNLGHLAFNAIACAVAYALTPKQLLSRLPVFFATAALIISGALLVLEPEMGRYAGASGIVCGWLFLAALANLTAPRLAARLPKWAALLLGAIIIVKVSIEWLASTSLIPHSESPYLPVHLAHATGVAVALVFHLGSRAPEADNLAYGVQKSAVQ